MHNFIFCCVWLKMPSGTIHFNIFYITVYYWLIYSIHRENIENILYEQNDCNQENFTATTNSKNSTDIACKTLNTSTSNENLLLPKVVRCFCQKLSGLIIYAAFIFGWKWSCSTFNIGFIVFHVEPRISITTVNPNCITSSLQTYYQNHKLHNFRDKEQSTIRISLLGYKNISCIMVWTAIFLRQL